MLDDRFSNGPEFRCDYPHCNFEYYDKCDRCLIADSTNEYLHFCSKHLYHNKNQHSLHCKTVGKIQSNFGSAADLSPSLESSSSSYDLNCHDTTLINKMASNQSLIDLTTNSNDIEIKNNDSNASMSLDSNGAQTKLESMNE